MDFWTAFPYWGILVLIGINALLVLWRKVEVEGDEDLEASRRDL